MEINLNKGNGFIYKLTTPDNKVYIGKTKSLKRRFVKYKNCIEQGLMYIEIQKHGWQNIKKEILYQSEYNEELFSELEKHYIRLFNTFDSDNGLNSQSGGKKGFLTSKKSLQNISISHIGNKPSEETKIKMSLARLGKTFKWSKESSKEKLSKARTGMPIKGCVVVDLCTGVFFNSVQEASMAYNIKRSTLDAKLRGVITNNTNLKKLTNQWRKNVL